MSFMARIGYFNWRYLALLPRKSFPKGRVINPGQNKARAKPPQGKGSCTGGVLLTQPIKCLIDLKDKAMDCSAGVDLQFLVNPSLPQTAKWKDNGSRRASWGPHLGQHGSSHQNSATCPAKKATFDIKKHVDVWTTGQLFDKSPGPRPMSSRWTAFFWFHDPSIVLRVCENPPVECNQLTTLFASEDGSFVGQWYLESQLCYPELLPKFFQLHLTWPN